MDALDFIAALVSAAAWPLTVIIVLLFLKGPITELISRVTRITHNSTIIDLESLQNESFEIDYPVKIDERANNAIQRDPRAAIIEAWIRLEWTAQDILQELNIQVHPRSPIQMIRILQEHQLLRGNIYELLIELREVRNMAAHQLDIDINADYAQDYVQLTERAIASIRENAQTLSAQNS